MAVVADVVGRTDNTATSPPDAWRARLLVVALVAVAASPVVLAALSRVGDQWLPVGDWASMEYRTSRVGTGDTPPRRRVHREGLGASRAAPVLVGVAPAPARDYELRRLGGAEAVSPAEIERGGRLEARDLRIAVYESPLVCAQDRSLVEDELGR